MNHYKISFLIEKKAPTLTIGATLASQKGAIFVSQAT